MSDPTTSTQPQPAAPKPRKKSRLKRVLYLMAFIAGVLVAAVLIGGPLLLSSKMAEGYVLEAVQPHLRGEVKLDDVSFSWGRGFEISGLRVDNPTGYSKTPALELGAARAGISFTSLLRGKFKASIYVEKPVLHVEVLEDGSINYKELARSDGSGSSGGGSGGGGHDDKGEDNDSFDRVQLRFELRNGTVVIDDKQRKLRQEISGIRVDLANDAFGAPLKLSADANVQTGGGKTGTVRATAQIRPADAQPLDFFTFDTSGIELGDYEPLVSAFVPGDRFESFRGRLQGQLSARPAEGGERGYEVVGDLTVSQLDVRGGALGEGRGIVSPTWTIKPNLRIDPKTKTAAIDGTVVDVGFAKITSLPSASHKLLFGDAIPSAPLALQVDIDLAELGKQPLLPKGQYKGKVQVLVGGTMPNDDGTLPFAMLVGGSHLAVQGDFMPEGSKLPQFFTLASTGKVDGNTTTGKWTLESQVAKGGGDYRVAQGWSASAKLELLTKELQGLIAGFLPKGMTLTGPSTLELTASGARKAAQGVGGRDDKHGGLFSPGTASNYKLSGKLSAPKLSYLGNALEGFAQSFSLDGGVLHTKTLEGGKLNGGPLALGFEVSGLEGEEQRFDFDFSWKNGTAKGGLTPLLQYAVPLLAGLPTKNLDRVAQIDFSSKAGFVLKGGGPLPKSGTKLLDALKAWNANGELRLADGAFSPATQLAPLMKLFEDKSRIKFDDILTKLRVEGGRVYTKGFRMGGKDGTVTIDGSTALSGELAAKVDFTDLLAKHKDGKRALSLLKGKRLTLDIAGTLWSPKVDVADFAQDLLKKGLENAVGDFLKGLGEGKDPGKALKDILRGLGK